MPCNVHMLLILCMRNYILLVCRILLTTFYITISTGRSKSKKNGRKQRNDFPLSDLHWKSRKSWHNILGSWQAHYFLFWSIPSRVSPCITCNICLMDDYTPELAIFLFAKMHFAYSKLPSSVISLVNSFHEHQSVSAECFALRSV
mgnify:CR=1 FL=1